jgi:hypothetical protein
MTTLATAMMELVSGAMEIVVGRPCADDLPAVRWNLNDEK